MSLEKLLEQTKEYFNTNSPETQESLPPRKEDKNVKWVYIGSAEPWYKRFKVSTLLTAFKMVLSPEGWWRIIETLAALNEVNLEVYKRPQDKFNSVVVYHKATRSRIVLRGDANVDIHANRHFRADSVVMLMNCSEEADADPMTRLFGVKPNL